jgi:hypothetical protein
MLKLEQRQDCFHLQHKGNLMNFEQWMKKVNLEINLLCGLSADDLPDCCYQEWFEDRKSPKMAAKKAIKMAGE